MKHLIIILALLLSSFNVAHAETENWNDANNWTVENGGTCNSISNTLSCYGSVVVKHKTLVYSPKYPMSISGWLKSPDIGTRIPSYFGAVLQSVVNGNYYGSIALGNWIDDYHGIFQPQWIIFQNEWNQTNNPAWFVAYPGKPSNPVTGIQPFTLSWNPSNSEGTIGRWTTTIKVWVSKTVVHQGPILPMLTGGVSPRLGFGRGRAIVGPLTMTGTKEN